MNKKGKKRFAEGGMVPKTPKQKKFAALAEPRDKITYADKIAGATGKSKNETRRYGQRWRCSYKRKQL